MKENFTFHPRACSALKRLPTGRWQCSLYSIPLSVLAALSASVRIDIDRSAKRLRACRKVLGGSCIFYGFIKALSPDKVSRVSDETRRQRRLTCLVGAIIYQLIDAGTGRVGQREWGWEWERLVGGCWSSWQLVAIAPSQLDCFAFAFDSLIFSATALKLARGEEGG